MIDNPMKQKLQRPQSEASELGPEARPVNRPMLRLERRRNNKNLSAYKELDYNVHVNDKIKYYVSKIQEIFPDLLPADANSFANMMSNLSDEQSRRDICEKVKSTGSIPFEFFPQSIVDAKRQWDADRKQQERLSFSPEKRAEENAKAAARMQRLRASKPSP